MSDCLFCKIVAGDIPATIVHQDDDLLAFRDISPQAPVHILVVPKKHIASMNEAGEEDRLLVARLFLAARDLAGEVAHPGVPAGLAVGDRLLDHVLHNALFGRLPGRVGVHGVEKDVVPETLEDRFNGRLRWTRRIAS